MTEEERKAHALRIANEVLDNVEYSYVYEGEELEDATEDDWGAIHRLILDKVKAAID